MLLQAIFLTFVLSGISSHQEEKYEPNWESLDKRPIPTWFDDEKFGIFMHWGVYSVIGLHDAWFWWHWHENVPDVVEYMKKNYPPGFTYGDLATQFTAELFNPNEYAEIIKRSGAKYFVLVSKHHDGFTLWPSEYSWNWNSMDVGPHRDLVGDLATAVRAKGVRFGLYYSLFAFLHPLYLKDKANKFITQEYVKEVMLPQLREIINTYRPEVLWSDGDWEATDKYWDATEFLAWLYNESPVKDTIVPNDRWGIDTWCKHGGIFNCYDRYSPGVLQKHKWENAMTIERDSWGIGRNSTIAEILSIQELLLELAKTISTGGNLLMNVGPTHYGKILPIQEERLTQVGQWLSVNGDAVFESKPWIYQNDTLNPNVWYTSKVRNSAGMEKSRVYNPQNKENTIVYAFVFKWPDDNQLKFAAPKLTEQTKVSMLGYSGTLSAKPSKPNGLTVDLNSIQWSRLPNLWAWVFKLEYLERDDRVPPMV